jgi:hypothetical protein
MAVTFDNSSISMDIHQPDDCYPDVRTVRDKTGAPGASFFVLDSAVNSHGIWMKGEVKFVLGPGDLLKGWRVGFVQIVRMNELTIRYSGRIGSEGSIVVDPLALASTNVLLDCSGPGSVPWSSLKLPDGSEIKGEAAHVTTQDNPNQTVPATLQNPRKSKVTNFLYDYKQDCEFWTILTAMDPAQAPHYLAYMHWQFVHKVDFFWRTGDPLPSEWGSFKVVEKSTLGAPTASFLQSILAKPSGPIANIIFRNAIGGAFTATTTAGRTESPTGLSPMRIDFWRATDLPANVA